MIIPSIYSYIHLFYSHDINEQNKERYQNHMKEDIKVCERHV
jgi:hypothetical protein